jgi:hypothetical protein
MFIELEEPAAVREELARLAGIQNAVALEIGGVLAPAREVRPPDEDPDRPAETVSVHMLRFPLSDDLRDAFRDPAVPAAIVVDHPQYSDVRPIVGATRTSLIADLALPPA